MNELYHHGILGQKWGEQNGPPYPLDTDEHNSVVKDHEGQLSKTEIKYQKMSKKLSKIESKMEKQQAKANKYQLKADAKRYGLFANPDKVSKYQTKADKKQYKVLRTANKGRKYYEKMKKTFADTEVSLTESQIKTGENFVNKLNSRTFASYVL